jgi:Family of unknown function (DUF6463)
MNHFPGRALMATGIGHALLGLVLFREPLAAIVREGIANTIRDGQYDREAALWFLLFSPLCFLLGQLVNHAIEHRDRRLFALVGWNLIAIGGVGALIAPVSGFWILLAIAPLVFWVARKIDAGAVPAARMAQRRA